MAIEVKSSAGKFDRFETKCPHCGKKLSYSRENVRAHVRWPNGFIYCPGCKRPIGHNEDNLVEKGEDIVKAKANKEGADVERLERQVRQMRAPKIVMFAVGIPVLVVGAILFTISLAANLGLGYNALFFFIFNSGLAMTITGGVLSKIINDKTIMIETLK